MQTKHDRTAMRIARKEKVEYNQGPGPDIISSSRVIEVETVETVRDGLRQLQGFDRPVYIAGVDEQATRAAMKVTEGTTVGVVDPQGEIIKRSSRKRRR